MKSCSNCGAETYARGRCRLCYVYWMKHGAERPEEIRVSLARRRLDRELMRKAWGPLARCLAEREMPA